MNKWSQITAAAVVGTDQQELLIPTGNEDLDRVLQQLKGMDREQHLLSSVSVVALYKQAGLELMVEVLPGPIPCDVEEKARGSAASGQQLSLMLEGEFREVLPEWLVAMTNAGSRVPEEYLPALLDYARDDPSLHELILPVLGKRGEWLATQNPDWSYVTTEGQEWETSSREERLLLLGRLRSSDPGQARKMLESTWQRETAKDRAGFLEKLLVNLNEDDEGFLVQALNDRSGEVRRVARTILANLPQSEFATRVRAVLSEVMTLKKPLLGKARIEVGLPDDPLEWVKAKGIEIDSPPRTRAAQSMGPKGWTLRELVALSDPDFFRELWHKTPLEIVNAASESEWASSLLEGLIQAARRARKSDWIEALIKKFLQEPHESTAGSTIVDLASYLPADRLEALITNFVKQSSMGLNDQNPSLMLLLAHRSAWSDSLSRFVIHSIKTRIRKTEKPDANDWGTRSALKQFARYIPPELHDELVSDWPIEANGWSAWAKSIHAFNSLLSFRADIYRALRSDN